MASSATTILGLEKQGTGDNSNAWGGVLNTQLDLIEEAVAGSVTISLASGSVTLTTTDYASNQSRPSHLLLSGAIPANRTVTVPAKSKIFCVTNSCTQTTDYLYSVTVKTSGGTGVVIPIGGRPIWVRCDGTNVVAVNGLPFAAVGTTADVSMSSTNNKVFCTFAAADVQSDMWSMTDHANDRITPPAGCELFQISVNLLLNNVTIPSTTQIAAGIEWSTGSAGSGDNAPYVTEATQQGSGVGLNPISVSGLFYMPSKTLGSTTRLDYFRAYCRLSVNTASAAINAFEINAVALR
jgi:hypothetical protein